MAGLLHKLLKKPSPIRIITNFNNPLPSKLSAPFLLHQPHPIDFKPTDPISYLNPILGSPNNDKNTLSRSQQFYPSFPFGYYLNPISPTGTNLPELGEEEVTGSGDDAKTIWADSVKKKRKRKMNKHKYRKLRKRMARQT